MKRVLVLAAAASALACAPPRGTIGAVLSQDSDARLRIVEAPKELAAAKAGLRPGDEIILIDGIDVRSLTDQDLHRVLSGEIDQPVQITALRGEEVVRVTLKRSEAKRLRARR